MTADRTGVLVMAYGTPRSPAEIESYYTDIRRGRPPTPEALADLTRRYEAIGGVSPLARLTEAQAQAIQAALDDLRPDRFRVMVGLKHAAPTIEDTAATLAADGCARVVGLVLAPHSSASSVGQYLSRSDDQLAAADPPVPFAGIESWAREPAFVDFLATDIAIRLERMRNSGHSNVRLIFTAHALPRRIVESGDPYADELRSTAEAVSRRLHLREGTDWSIAWQSAGRTPEPWIGPDILEVLDELGEASNVDGVIVCACGFVADHLEVLYDLDIEAADRAAVNGLSFDRSASVNDDPDVMAALARRVAGIA